MNDASSPASSAHVQHFPQEVPHDPPGRTVTVSAGRDAHVVIDGDLQEPCVAFVHGVPGTTRDARYLGPALARRGLSCVRIDMPGFGLTPVHSEPKTSASDRARFVLDVLRALGVPRFAVAGHSIGGAVALALAAHAPAQVTALCLINSVGVRRHRGLVVPSAVHTTLARLATTPLGGGLARRLEQHYAGRGLRPDKPLDPAVFAHHVRIVAALDFLEQRRNARAVHAPTLLFSTDDDVFIEPFITTTLRDTLTHASIVSHLRTATGGHHGQKRAAAPIADWFAVTLRP